MIKVVDLILVLILLTSLVNAVSNVATSKNCDNPDSKIQEVKYSIVFSPPIISEHNTNGKGYLEDVRGEKFSFLGKQYKIVIADHVSVNFIRLIMMGDSSEEIISEGEIKKFFLKGKQYEVEVTSVDDTKVSFRVNSEFIENLRVSDLFNLGGGIFFGVIELVEDSNSVKFMIGTDKIEFRDSDTLASNYGATINIDEKTSVIKGDILVQLDQGIANGNDIEISGIILKYDASKDLYNESNYIKSEIIRKNPNLATTQFSNQYATVDVIQNIEKECTLSQTEVEIFCGDEKVNLSNDISNCGICNNVCESVQTCMNGKCTLCGNGICDYEENCGSCLTDCSCDEGMSCLFNVCSNTFCGNDICDLNENCENCQSDCSCLKNEECINNVCSEKLCGNGVCDSTENCETCLEDCACNEKFVCLNEKCILKCSSDLDCIDDNACTTDSCIGLPKECTHVLNEGCNHDGKCLTLGTRVNKQYCSIDNIMINWKMLGEKCLQNYECDTSVCKQGICQNTFVGNIVNWFKGIFGIV